MPLTFWPFEPQVFQQKLDVSRVWFARNNWPVLIHSDLHGSIQNCAVFVIILRKTNLNDFIENNFFPGKQHVVTVAPNNRGIHAVHVATWTAQTSLVPNCSNLLVRKVVSHKSRISRLVECSKKLSNHARCCVLLRQSLFTDSWWMAIQHEQLDVQFPRHVVVNKSEGHT